MVTSSAAYTQGHIKSDIAFFSLYRMLKISIISQEYNTAKVILCDGDMLDKHYHMKIKVNYKFDIHYYCSHFIRKG